MKAELNGWTILAMLEWGTNYFAEKGVPSPRMSIEWLLAEILGNKRLDLYLDFERPLAPDELQQLRPLIKRRARHEPLQYITETCDFLNIRLSVGPDVLIPRMETEQLTEMVLNRHASTDELSALDLGTGSGCIAVALKTERPGWNITGIDNSEKALRIARKNAEQLNAVIHFVQADIHQRLPDDLSSRTFDLIVSNPPYILPGEKESLERQVKDYEPPEALFCQNIKKEYHTIAEKAACLLKKKGILYLEINDKYPEAILSVFDPKKWRCSVVKDYNKNPRFLTAHLGK
jgi:release factor glutamine methyltransferase